MITKMIKANTPFTTPVRTNTIPILNKHLKRSPS